MTAGAGAWRQPKLYRRGMAEQDLSRVRLAVIGIQKGLIDTGHLDARPGALDGGFGPKTEASVKSFQKAHGLTEDGLYGMTSSRTMWGRYFLWWQVSMKIPDNLLTGMAAHESGLDPGAQGSYDDRDRGIMQFNSYYQSVVTDELAYGNPPWCIQRAAGQLRDAYDKLGSWECAVANHNSPKKALDWSRSGQAPDKQISDYVAAIYKAAVNTKITT